VRAGGCAAVGSRALSEASAGGDTTRRRARPSRLAPHPRPPSCPATPPPPPQLQPALLPARRRPRRRRAARGAAAAADRVGTGRRRRAARAARAAAVVGDVRPRARGHPGRPVRLGRRGVQHLERGRRRRRQRGGQRGRRRRRGRGAPRPRAVAVAESGCASRGGTATPALLQLWPCYPPPRAALLPFPACCHPKPHSPTPAPNPHSRPAAPQTACASGSRTSPRA
jgi:hypothetical protein